MAVIDRSNVPAVITLSNNSSRTINVPLYRVSGISVDIASGDELKITVNSSYELIYYMDNLAIEGLNVVVA